MSLYNSVKSNSNSEFLPIRLKNTSWDKFNLFRFKFKLFVNIIS